MDESPQLRALHMIKASQTILKIFQSPCIQHAPIMRPHTYVYLRVGKRAVPLGVIFTEWPPSINRLRFTGNKGGDEVVEIGTFEILYSAAGDEIGRAVLVNERWCWNTMLAKHKGLSAGNL